MSNTVIAFDKETIGVDTQAVLNALAMAVIVVNADGLIIYVNNACEQLFKVSAANLSKLNLQELLPKDSPLFYLLDQVREAGNAICEYGVIIETPRIGRHFVNIQASPLADTKGCVVIAFQERSIADKIDRQLTHRGAARSVIAMAAMLAHEVKNPMSGIRGAAQLLEENATPSDLSLTRLICDEVDRICALIDRMDVFSDAEPLQRQAINIHEVLGRVCQLAQNGFGSHLQFIEDYDPSLPLVLGNRDQLTQVFLNLVKNAAEAAPQKGGKITLKTAFRHGVSFVMPTTKSRVHLPLEISVEDNGEGISEDIQSHMFDPFVSSKPKGSGLGLAMVAKIISDHTGVVEFDSQPSHTVFRVMLPMHSGRQDQQ